jgi:hypothetical protein
MSLRHGIERTVVSVPLGTLAYGEAKEPGHIAELARQAGDLPVYGETIERVGSFMSQHHNPTVAFLGLSAAAIAINRGPLFVLPGLAKTKVANIKSKLVRPIPSSQTAKKANTAAMKASVAKNSIGLSQRIAQELQRPSTTLVEAGLMPISTTTPNEIVEVSSTTTISQS